MSWLVIATLMSHFALAIVLFLCVNWIGKHAVEFGYASMTLFEEVNESAALNFFLRVASPTVFIIIVSAVAVAIERPDWRIGIYWVAIYYYIFRALVIFLVNRQRLVSWPKFAIHAVAGIAVTMVAYRYLVIPNRSLLPNLEQMGNELWLAILAFLYTVANKVPVRSGPAAKRRNNFVAIQYEQAHRRFGGIIDTSVSDEKLRLIVYSVLIFENYARPAAIRWIERAMFWKTSRTTGIMQVAASRPLSDTNSVKLGLDLLTQSWATHADEEQMYSRAQSTIADYNADSDYVRRVLDIMEILAKRVEKKFLPSYEEIVRWTPPVSQVT